MFESRHHTAFGAQAREAQLLEAVLERLECVPDRRRDLSAKRKRVNIHASV